MGDEFEVAFDDVTPGRSKDIGAARLKSFHLVVRRRTPYQTEFGLSQLEPSS